MPNPLSEITRKKALFAALAAAGAATLVTATAAVNIGLLSPRTAGSAPAALAASHEVAAQPQAGGADSGTTNDLGVDIVYQDVFEHVSGGDGSASQAAPAAGTASGAPSPDAVSSSPSSGSGSSGDPGGAAQATPSAGDQVQNRSDDDDDEMHEEDDEDESHHEDGDDHEQEDHREDHNDDD